jgi:hypothetical protein
MPGSQLDDGTDELHPTAAKSPKIVVGSHDALVRESSFAATATPQDDVGHLEETGSKARQPITLKVGTKRKRSKLDRRDDGARESDRKAESEPNSNPLAASVRSLESHSAVDDEAADRFERVKESMIDFYNNRVTFRSPYSRLLLVVLCFAAVLHWILLCEKQLMERAMAAQRKENYAMVKLMSLATRQMIFRASQMKNASDERAAAEHLSRLRQWRSKRMEVAKAFCESVHCESVEYVLFLVEEHVAWQERNAQWINDHWDRAKASRVAHPAALLQEPSVSVSSPAEGNLARGWLFDGWTKGGIATSLPSMSSRVIGIFVFMVIFVLFMRL